MSDATFEALEQAIRAHVADETNGKILTDWALLTAAVGVEPHITTYVDACSETAGHSIEGLIAHGLRRIVERQDYGMSD